MKPPRFETLARWSLIVSLVNAAFVAVWSLAWAFGLGRWAEATLSPMRALALRMLWAPPTLATMVLTFIMCAWAQRRWRAASAELDRIEREP